MTWDDWDKAITALTIWREASGEGMVGMRAVLHVIMNRASRHNLDLAQVCEQPWQFSSLTAPGDPCLIKWPKKTDQSFTVADCLVDQPGDDPTGGAEYYRNVATATSTDFQKMVDSGQIKQTVVIGHHTFYAPVEAASA